MKKRDVERHATKFAAALLQGQDLPDWATDVGIDNSRDAAIFMNKVHAIGNELSKRAARPGETYITVGFSDGANQPPRPF